MWEGGVVTDIKGGGYEGLDRVQVAQYMVQWWAHKNKVLNIWTI